MIANLRALALLLLWSTLLACGASRPPEETASAPAPTRVAEVAPTRGLRDVEATPERPTEEPNDLLIAPPDVQAPPPDAARTPSGLATKVLRQGFGQVHPGPTSEVTVHYSGWTTDGALFDSSYRRGRPATFPLDRVIPGWTEGLQLMVAGERRRLWIPEQLAYGGRPGPPQGMLVFDVELLAVDE